MIEKRITPELLEAGELVLTPRDCVELALPEHSATIDIEVEGEAFGAQWSGRSRRLSGDLLTERLQDYGQAGGLLRLRRVEETYRLALLPPGSQMQTSRSLPEVVIPKAAAGSKAARRRATVDRQFHSDDKYDWGASDPRTIGFLTEARELLSDQLRAAGFDPLEMVELRLQGEELATLDDFEELLAVDIANVDRMPHQAAAARHALSRLRGRAILADEVGLGKTIEAGLAIKELTLRGLAKRVLILCPAPLREQWREEMNQKFDLQFDVAYTSSAIGSQDKLILSLSLAKYNDRNIRKLTEKPWDIVIVDEAHRAAGPSARKTRELITPLTTACRYALFLTATPVQNDLLELYRLVELLRPGTFKSERAFKSEFMTGYDPRTPSDPAALRRLISSAMIRTTRAQAGVDRVVRRPVDVPIDLGTQERELYALSTDLLRNVMRDSGDTMRRRSLALRLTASPFSMGTTALRMAERHPDPHVRKILSDIGHFAMDIRESARENAALEITRQWLREHGRVLIFTQHTDTVTGLLRRIGTEGLTARSFHGSMSPSERAATIAAFRSGEAPIMISTDAGAEGQNLQFCNCVLNYDLPWNPMRIEQRIGRVDRLTQPRDEVFVANLYARNTIDQRVYHLLAEKLRMFELLFGQVTTILGEIDDSKSATFETRVMNALFADSDTKMERLLSQLGTELADARQRASTLIAADSGLSSWMASAAEHRQGLTKAGSTELAPDVTERARIRQRRVQAWVRRVLNALGGQVLHDTGEGDGAFMTVQLDDEVADDLGGRTLMHLAFDRHGLEHHPDAELCAVGSPVFDELLGLLRMRGDMHATVPVIPDDIGPSPFRHASGTTLVRRRLIPSGTWSGHATFRATVGEAEITEHVITAGINKNDVGRLPRRPLEDGETLPAAFGEARQVVLAFEREAAKQLEERRAERAEDVEREQARELTRIRDGYNAQIAEAAYDDVDRLQRALKSEERRLGRTPDIRARAKLLAVVLDEDDWQVEETWAGRNGAQARLTYDWGLPQPPEVESDASASAIEVLALCSNAHWVDESEAARCGSCDRDLCAACGEDAVFADCPLCGVSCCLSCRTDISGLCARCTSSERAPELDTEFGIGWRLKSELSLVVGQRVVELIRPGQAGSSLVVPEGDVHDPNRIRVRSYAVDHGLPADSGLTLRDLSQRPALQNNPARLRLRTSKSVDIEFSISDDPGNSIDSSGAGDLPGHDPVSVASDEELRLVPLLTRLRSQVPPPNPPTIVATRRSTFADVYLEADGLVEQVSVVADDGMLVTVKEQAMPFAWRPVSAEDAVLAEAEFGQLHVSLLRRSDAVLVRLDDRGSSAKPKQWVALPNGTSADEQLAWFDALCSRGTPGGRVGRRSNEAHAISGPFPSPSECELVNRAIHPIAELADVDGDVDLVPADSRSLKALSLSPPKAPGQDRPDPLPIALSAVLLERTARSFTAMVCNGFEVHEMWSGHGTALHQYRTFDGRSMAPTLDDVGIRAVDFGVCRDGHFYEADGAALCGSCATWSCGACDEIHHQASTACPSCTAAVCRRCLLADHPEVGESCTLCDDAACATCGRNPEVQPCVLCARTMCLRCRNGDLCRACDQLAPATEEQLRGLPTDLAVEGAAIVTGHDTDATTVLINRGDAFEQAVVREQQIGRWVAFGRTIVDDIYRLRLAASREFSVQVKPIAESVDREQPIDTPHVAVHWERSFTPAWSVTELSVSGLAATSFPTPDGELAQLIAEEFPAAGRLPSATKELPEQVLQAFASTPLPSTVELTLRWHRVGHDLVITASGMSTRIFEGPSTTEESIAWAGIDTALRWVTEDWSPTPAIGGYVKSGSTEAVIVGMASLAALGIRTDHGTDWYSISESPAAVAATALARSMGLDDADQVTAFTDPAKVVLSTVLNASDSTVSVQPLGVVNDDVRGLYRDFSMDALQAWFPDAQLRAPELGKLPHALRTFLDQRLRAAISPTRLEIGAQVEQIVAVDDRQVWSHMARLAPGETDARRVDSITRVPRDQGLIDREGHFGAGEIRCRYCNDRVCGHCVDGLVSCDCCSAAICRRCVAEPSEALLICPACASLRPPSRSEARQHGRLLLTRNMLIGSDAHSVVVVEYTKKHWNRHAGNGEKCAVANPSVSRFLHARLAGFETEPAEV
ncbi:MAG: SNF2-related protein [Mycolicibacter algericus]|uniref:SNF2-related protein n=1 Tax=Mycolicibacter algericus TaxID=1288388 RepID=UPI003C7283A2